MEQFVEKMRDKISKPAQPEEGQMTKKIEKVTAQVPSMTWLVLAFGSMAISAGLAMLKQRKGAANFVGLWVPTLLLIGLYNKIVKIEGSDSKSKFKGSVAA